MIIKKIVIGVCIFVFLTLGVNAQSISVPLSQQDIMAMSKPSIVKIYHQISGKITIPTIKLDIATMSLSVDNKYIAPAKTTFVASPDSVISYKFDYDLSPQTVYGTGFIVNPDGYVITNAHVASDSFIEQSFLTKLEHNLIDYMIGSFDDKYPKKLDQMYPTKSEWTEIYKKLDVDMMKLVVDNVKFESQLVVIPQSSTDTELKDIIRDGFPAKVISAMDDLLTEKNQDKDLALIKIEQNNLPALKIDATKSIQIGQKVFIWGFPSSAEFNSKDVIDPTLTDGIVNAFKDSSDKSFKLIQTDAKISEGSSGSPILNEKGEVVGIITYSSAATESVGDSFGWGIPSELILQVMENGSVSNDTSYYDNFSAGASLLNQKKCKSANERFNKILNTNENFPVNLSVQPYIDICVGLISSGQSMDSVWSEMWFAVKGFVVNNWIGILLIVGGLILLISTIIMLILQNKKEEVEIAKIIVVNNNQEKEIENLKNQPKV